MDHGIVLVPSDGQNNKRKKWGRLVGVLEARRQWTVYKSAAVTAHVAPRIMIERCRVVTPWRDAAAAFNDLPLSLSLSLSASMYAIPINIHASMPRYGAAAFVDDLTLKLHTN